VPARGAAQRRRLDLNTAQFGSAGRGQSVLRQVMRDSRPPTDLRQSRARIAVLRMLARADMLCRA